MAILSQVGFYYMPVSFSSISRNEFDDVVGFSECHTVNGSSI